MQRILAIDDDPGVRDFLKRGLSYEGYGVDLAETGTAGLDSIAQRPPDLVILDLMLPDLEGHEVLRRLRLSHPQLPVIMLTGKDGDADQLKGLAIGADDYVLKPVRFEVLLARIRALMRRRGKPRGVVLGFADLSLDLEAFSVTRARRQIQLTAQEFKLLQTFLEQPERVMNKRLLLDRVWGAEPGRDDNVVEVYVKQLRQKLEAEGEPRLIHTIRGIGYVLKER